MKQSPSPSSLVICHDKLDWRVRRAAYVALATMDQLHHMPKTIRATLTHDRRRRWAGVYDPQTVHITISCLAPDLIGTFLHEFGHFIDNRMLHPLSREYASRYDSQLVDLLALCFASPSLQIIEKVLRQHVHHLSHDERSFLKEAYEPHDVFARAYMQWICTRSADVELHASLNHRIARQEKFAGVDCRFQWEHDEFADIMLLMETLFRNKGLL